MSFSSYAGTAKLILTKAESSPLTELNDFMPSMFSSELLRSKFLGAGVTWPGMRLPTQFVLWMRSPETGVFLPMSGVKGEKMLSGGVVQAWIAGFGFASTTLCWPCWQKSATMHNASVGPAHTELDLL